MTEKSWWRFGGKSNIKTAFAYEIFSKLKIKISACLSNRFIIENIIYIYIYIFIYIQHLSPGSPLSGKDCNLW